MIAERNANATGKRRDSREMVSAFLIVDYAAHGRWPHRPPRGAYRQSIRRADSVRQIPKTVESDSHNASKYLKPVMTLDI
jgi:hypothetical protein